MIWIIIFLTALSILLLTVFQNSSLKKKYNNELDTAAENLRHCESRFNTVKQSVFDSILRQYGERFANNVVEEKICENMLSELLVLSWGEPEDKKSEFYKGNKSESWFYDGFTNRLGNRKYRKVVYVENNRITGWKDLN